MRKHLTKLRGVKCLFHVADDFFILVHEKADPPVLQSNRFFSF